MREVVAAVLDATLDRVEREGLLPRWEGRPAGAATLDAPKNPAHGDWASNAALLYGRAIKRSPREVAELIRQNLTDTAGAVTSLEVAGPGFLNFRLSPDVFLRELERVAGEGERFGGSKVGNGQKVNVEFVSANPTGPMHFGHGRGAVTGDVLCTLLAATGHRVTREYYINDAGNQVATLARSVHLRYRQLFGEKVELPEDSYPGEYVIAIAQEIKDRDGNLHLGAPESAWLQPFYEYAVDRVLREIRADLDLLGIRFDVWFSERKQLHDSGELRAVLAELRARDLLYDKDGAVFFRSTRYGDDKDRPVIKSSGELTYLAGDIAYHKDKFARGFDWCLDVWGADHHGKIPGIRAAIKELGVDPARLRFAMIQMVNLLKEGQPFKMSKRAGTVVSLREVIEDVGRDATRFFFLMRRSDAQLDFDVALAKAQSQENPVYYVQYGHARLCSILRRAKEQGLAAPRYDLTVLRALTLPEEMDLVKRIVSLPDLFAGAALSLEPHRLVFFLQETVAAFHGYYTRYKGSERVIGPDPQKTAARLFLCESLRQAMANTLALLGISAPEQMSSREAEDESLPAGS